jgi:hypothetical protein
MTDLEPRSLNPVRTAEEARVRVGTALAVIELASQVLDGVPPPETALPSGDRELFRYLQAAETARGWLVGHDAADGVDRPGRSSALGGGQRIYEWGEEETERHFRSALEELSKR